MTTTTAESGLGWVALLTDTRTQSHVRYGWPVVTGSLETRLTNKSQHLATVNTQQLDNEIWKTNSLGVPANHAVLTGFYKDLLGQQEWEGNVLEWLGLGLCQYQVVENSYWASPTEKPKTSRFKQSPTGLAYTHILSSWQSSTSFITRCKPGITCDKVPQILYPGFTHASTENFSRHSPTDLYPGFTHA